MYQFGEQYKKNLSMALRSGAISEDVDFGAILKCIAVITGENFMSLHPDNRDTLANLRHFI